MAAARRAEGTVRASLLPSSGHAQGSRASLVDAVLDLPEVQPSSRPEAAVPLGDGGRLEPTEGTVARQARLDRLGACGHAARRPGLRLVIAAW